MSETRRLESSDVAAPLSTSARSLSAPDVERWRQAAKLVEAALDLPAERRMPFLLQSTGTDTALLHDASRWLEATSAPSTMLDTQHALTNQAIASTLFSISRAPIRSGSRIGAWRVVRTIGHGGMGEVFEAERADGSFDMRVALKVLRAAPDSVVLAERFQQERTLLASLDHPGIARLLDGGVLDDGTPFYVMELVDGEPINTWCARHQRSVRERVALVRQLCSALTYAHSRLIVHRDIKPSNVLVTAAGHVKIVDFGLADVVRREGEPRGDDGSSTSNWNEPFALTPAYASPEQFRGEPPTAAVDVYALSALLYELLVGVPPFGVHATWPKARDAAATGVLLPPSVAVGGARDAQNTPPPIPAHAARQLRGDIDAIVAKGLAPDPKARYESMASLDSDLAAWLETRPITARSIAWYERGVLLVRRHTLATALVASAVTVLMAATTIAVVQEARAIAAAARVTETNRFLLGLFRMPYALDSGSTRQQAMRRMLDSGRMRFATRGTASSELDAELFLALSKGYAGLSEHQISAQLAQRAVAALIASRGAQDFEVAKARASLAEALLLDGRAALAVAQYDSIMPRVIAEHGDGSETVGVMRQARARALMSSGDLDDASAELQAVIRILSDSGGRAPTAHAHAIHTLGHIAMTRGQFGDAEQFYRRALSLREDSEGSAVEIANTQGDLAMARFRQGDNGFADSLVTLSRATKVAHLGDLDLEVADDDIKLAWIAVARHQRERALALLARARRGYASVDHLPSFRTQQLQAATAAANGVPEIFEH